MTADCVFCDIITGRSDAVFVREWIDTIAILPRADKTGRRGCAEGHILVIPKVHVADFAVDPMVSAVTAHRLSELAHQLRAKTGLDYNEITSAGPDATQTVGHLHRHLVPRRPGDGLALPWTGQNSGEAR
jgi:diadenosine tetraphosphate (Ap4A) HIT family hydrolase